MNKTNNLRAYLRDLYEGIVSKKPDASRNPQNFRSDIEAIRTGGEFYEVMDASELPEDAPNGSLAIVEVEGSTGGGGSVVVCNDISPDKDKVFNAIKEISCPNATEVESYAFQGCTSLTSIDLPKVASIYSNAFQDCTSLTDVNISNATEVESYAFQGCTSLTSIDLPKVTFIKGNTFQGCTSLTDVNISNATVVYIGAFENCTSLTSIDLPNATLISDSAFQGCTSLTDVNISNATVVENCAFQGCTSLTSIDLPKVASIYSDAFENCTALTSIDLPNVTSIGDGAFFDCTNLDTLILRNTETMCSIILTAILGTKIATIEGVPTGEGFIYVPTTLYENYVANFTEQATYLLMETGLPQEEAVVMAEQISRAVLRKIEDYPEICGA